MFHFATPALRKDGSLVEPFICRMCDKPIVRSGTSWRHVETERPAPPERRQPEWMRRASFRRDLTGVS